MESGSVIEECRLDNLADSQISQIPYRSKDCGLIDFDEEDIATVFQSNDVNCDGMDSHNAIVPQD